MSSSSLFQSQGRLGFLSTPGSRFLSVETFAGANQYRGKMSKGESPKVPRRTTRSTYGSVSSSLLPTPRASVPSELTPSDLTFGEEPIGLDDLLSNFPGRRTQILEILRNFGPLDSPMLPLMVYGSSSTGKTSVVLQVLRHLNRPFVYSSCLSCYNARILFESFLNQLSLHRKNAENGYSSAKRCEKPSDFINFLREALTNFTEILKGKLAESSSAKQDAKPNGEMVYLVFDNLELIREWDKSNTILHFLFNLYDILKMPGVGILFISSASPDAYYSNMGYREAIPVYFPEYTEEDLRRIFMRNQENRKLYSSFLDVVLRPFCRITRRVDELSSVFLPLYRKYCEPLSDLKTVPSEDVKRRLFSHLQPHLTFALNETFSVSCYSSVDAEAKDGKKLRGGYRPSESCDAFEKLEFHMSSSAKYLLISAFLASRNPATLDASLFDSTGGIGSRKRKRKASEKSMEQKEIAEGELLMKGPGSFPLERLLAIYQCIASAEESSFAEEREGKNNSEANEVTNSLLSDVLLQLSSLCNANLVIKGGSCPLEGSTRYRSAVSEELALKVARSLNFPLSRYMYRR